MFERMTVNFEETSDKATFMHQMIPHHINAVNMAKILLTTAEFDMDDKDDEKAFWLLRAIINGQNQ